MKHFLLEFTGHEYLTVVAIDYKHFIAITKTNVFYKTFSDLAKKEKFTGKLYQKETFLNSPCVYISSDINGADFVRVLPTKKIDILGRQYKELETKLKEKEKEIIKYLKTVEGNTEVGSIYGGFYRHTVSTRPSYKQILEKVMDIVKKVFVLEVKNFKLIKAVEIYEEGISGKPHKSSLQTLHIFEEKDKEEKLKKIWID